MNVLLFGYGTGNLHSLAKALERCGASVSVGTDLEGRDALVLPGVGAFGAAARRLQPHGEAVRTAAAAGMPVLGVCLGMQLLLESSEEGDGEGLGLIRGASRRLRTARVPHMGWNEVLPAGDDPLFGGVPAGSYFYFAHSYAVDPAEPADAIAWTEHEGVRLAAAVRRGRVTGTQFHPEKSGDAGLRVLRNFVDGARP